jgi:hypothetical protein
MLEKVVLVVVSLFCMGTELRFKSQNSVGASLKEADLSNNDLD